MIRGTVIFKLTNVGSKSESEQPFLRLPENIDFRIMVKGDNPFMHDILRPYENKEVEIEGKFNERKIFMITDIKELNAEPDSEAQPDAEVIIAPAKSADPAVENQPDNAEGTDDAPVENADGAEDGDDDDEPKDPDNE